MAAAPPADSRIAPELRRLALPIDDLREWPDNPRRGNVAAVAASLAEFGQVRPVVVQASTMQVVAGNHVLKAARSLGWTTLAAVVEDMDEGTARRFLLADNRLADLAVYDTDVLTEVLGLLRDEDALAGTGFTEFDLDSMLSGAAAPVPMDDVERPEPEPAESAESWEAAKLRQVVLLIPHAEAEEFMRSVAALRGAYETSSTVATVLRAVERQGQVHRG